MHGRLIIFALAVLAPPCAAQTVDVTQFGTKGDGRNDDSHAIQAAIDATPDGATLSFAKAHGGTYLVRGPLRIGKALTLQGNTAVTLKQVAPHVPMFSITASHVTLAGLRLSGLQHATWAMEEDAIFASGAFRQSASPQFLIGISITGCSLDGFGDAGIKFLYVDGADIRNNSVSHVVNAGIGLLSVKHAIVSGNSVRQVSGVGVSGRNSWGIYASRLSNDVGELVSQPRSDSIQIMGNTIVNVPSWTGIDTHGGNAIAITSNIVTNTLFGIAVGVSINRSGNAAYAPTGITVANNILNSGVTDGSRQYGITFTGVMGGELASGAIRHNRVDGFGQSTSATVPAINIGATRALTVTDNVIREPGTVGIYIFGPNHGLLISGNRILDPWTNAGNIGAAFGIRVAGDDSDVTITQNSIQRADRVAKFTLSDATGFGIYIGAGLSNAATVSSNFIQAHQALENAGTHAVRQQ